MARPRPFPPGALGLLQPGFQLGYLGFLFLQLLANRGLGPLGGLQLGLEVTQVLGQLRQPELSGLLLGGETSMGAAPSSNNG